jgi:hypothetical protein
MRGQLHSLGVQLSEHLKRKSYPVPHNSHEAECYDIEEQGGKVHIDIIWGIEDNSPKS